MIFMKKTKRVALLGVFLAVSLILSYIENLFFGGLFMPGVKLGLSNSVVVVVLYFFGFVPAMVIGILKSFLSLLLFGRLSGFLYSVFGIVFAVSVMGIVKKTGKFSLLGVGISGSAAHIIGQLIAACIMLKDFAPLRLFPLLCILSVVSAIVLYIPEKSVLKLLSIQYSMHNNK